MEILRWRDLVKLAGSPEFARWQVDHGEWVRVVRDAYVHPEVEVTPAVRLAALRSVLPPGVVVGGRAALWLVGCLEAPLVLDLVVERGLHLAKREGFRMLSAALPDEEVCDLDGVAVVSPARACVDVLREEELVEAVVVVDQALRAGDADLQGVLAALDRAAGRRGVSRSRTGVALASERSESPMETRLRLKLLRGGLTGLLVQHDVYDREGHVARADLAVDGVLLEYDGREQRLEYESFVQDRQRQSRILDTGLQVRRFTARDVYQRPDVALVGEVLRAQRLTDGRDCSLVRPGPDTLRRPKRTPLRTRAQLRAA